MRPHLLEFTAIGSYPGAITVDFDAFTPYGLFHIHGPTGAGKSSLIDAMCFALYGTIPGPRLADSMRSHHADPKIEAVVRFTFSAQGETWKIIRTPAQLRAKLRGEGTTHQYATASLQRKEGGGWAPVASGAKEVDPIVQKLLGLDSSQFMQVVVLPQGGFQKVLRAGADEREKLLRRLFGTERFDRYTHELKERADALQQRVNSAGGSQHNTSQRIANLLAGFDITIDSFPDVIDRTTLDAVEERCEDIAELADEADNAAELLAKDAEKAEIKLRREFVLWERWQRKIGAESRLVSLEAERDDIDALRNELAWAERALPLAPLYNALQDAQNAFVSASTTRQVAQNALRNTINGVIAGETTICDALATLADSVPVPSRLDEVRRDIRARATEVHVAAEQARIALDAKADIEEFEAKLPLLTQALEQLQMQHDALVDKLNEHQSAIGELQTAASQESSVAERIRTLENRLAAAEALNNERRRTQQIQQELDTITEQAGDARARHLQLVERRIQAMAGELASSLIDGDPCTVCGSTSHPAPAVWSDVVSQDDIADASRHVQLLSEQAAAVQTQRDDAREREAAYVAAAGDVLDDAAEAVSTLNDLRIQMAVAQNALNQIDSRATAVRAVQDRLRAIETQQTATIQERIATMSRLDEARTHLNELEERIGSQASEHVIELAGALEAAHEAVDALAGSIEEERSRAENMEAARLRLAENAEAGGVDDVTDALAYLRNDEQLRLLRGRVKQWDEAFANAASTLEEPTVAAMARQPDIKTAETALQQAQVAHKHALTKAAHMRAQAAQIDDAVENLVAEFEKFLPLQQEYERVRTLADLCHGRGNVRKQSLERYILASYLEEVADAASRRLQLMSAGRYSLRHSDERVRGNGASGLALLVTDAYTGQEREVSTLSGGETFLASLALALGLADIVQAKSGGVHIDALFIDEGFGALDADALELAMAELDRLREGGRLVGVISHVAALQERIPAGIEVHRGPNGSTISQTTPFPTPVLAV